MGGIFAKRRRTEPVAVAADETVPRGLLMWMFGVVGVLGYIVSKDTQIPGVVLLIAGGTGLLALFFIGLKHPEVPLYMMVAYLPFSKILIGHFGGVMTALNMTNILLVVILIAWFSNTAGERRSFYEPHFLHLPVTLLTLWGIFAFIQASSRMGGDYALQNLSELKRWLDPIVMYFLFFHLVKTKRQFKTIVVIIMFTVAMAALMAIYEYINIGSGSLERSRIGGIAGQPNILGAFFVYYMFLYVSFWMQRAKQPVYWLLLIPFGLCFRGIMVTFSRGAYLAFAQGLLGLTFFKNKFLFVLMMGAIGFAVLNPWILPEGIQYRMSSTFRDKNTQITSTYGVKGLESSLDQSSAMRIYIWQGGLQMIKDHPVTGVGLGEFHNNVGLYQPIAAGYDAHNAYLITAAEFGVPALVFLIITVLVLMRISAVVYGRHPDPFVKATALGFLGGLSGLWMANMFGSRLNTTEVSGYFWILAALMARAYKWVKEESRAQRYVRPVIAAARFQGDIVYPSGYQAQKNPGGKRRRKQPGP